MADERKGRTQDENGVGQNTRLPAGRCGGGRAGLSRGVSLCARDEGALRRRGDNGVQPAPGHRRHLRRHADEPFYRERPALRGDARALGGRAQNVPDTVLRPTWTGTAARPVRTPCRTYTGQSRMSAGCWTCRSSSAAARRAIPVCQPWRTWSRAARAAR